MFLGLSGLGHTQVEVAKLGGEPSEIYAVGRRSNV